MAVILLYLLITNFSFNFKKAIELSAPVLLVDFSPSMRKHLKEILPKIDSLKFRYKKFFFSDSVYPDTKGVTPRFTNITNALLYGEKLASSGIVLISDGNHNFGPAPDEILNDFKTPIYCFAAGNRTINDQSIVDVLYSDYAFCNDTAAIEVVIETEGFGGKKGRAILKSKRIELSKDFKLSENISRHSVEFEIVPDEIGEQKFKVTLAPQIGESNYNNNEYSFSIKVFERKITILYYTDYPSFNTHFILNSLKKINGIEYTEVISVSENKYQTKGRFVDEGNIDINRFDILILDNIDGNFNRDLGGFLNKGKGILVVGNISGITPSLNEILPFSVTGTQFEGEFPVNVLLPFSVLSPVGEYAPVSKINRALGINQNTTLIARTGEFPLIGYRKVRNGSVFQINITEFGVWHFTQLNLNNKDILNRLIEDVLKFLSPYGKSERLLIKSAKNQYLVGEKIKVELKAYNQSLLPGSGGEFYLVFQNKKIPFLEIRPGIYEADFFSEKPGEFELMAMGNLYNDTLKSNKLSLRIVEIEVEPEELVNEQLLVEIATKTEGGFYNISQLKEINLPERQKKYEVVNFSFDKAIFYFLIFALVVVDWLIRKKGGMV